MSAREDIIEAGMDGAFLRWANVMPDLMEIEPETDLLLMRALDTAAEDGLTSEDAAVLVAEFQLSITTVALWTLVLSDRAKVRVEAERGVVFWKDEEA